MPKKDPIFRYTYVYRIYIAKESRVNFVSNSIRRNKCTGRGFFQLTLIKLIKVSGSCTKLDRFHIRAADWARSALLATVIDLPARRPAGQYYFTTCVGLGERVLIPGRIS